MSAKWRKVDATSEISSKSLPRMCTACRKTSLRLLCMAAIVLIDGGSVLEVRGFDKGESKICALWRYALVASRSQ